MRKFSAVLAYFASFITGGALYGLIELLWRGRTHWTMLLTGGVCSCFLYRLCAFRLPIWKRSLFGGGIITAVEFAVGCIVNRLFNMGVWDYSHRKFNILGQICPLYTFFWCLISLPALYVLKRLRTYISTRRL